MMDSLDNSYCRFCAECKSAEKLINIDSDESKFNDIISKLSFLNAMYVNVSNRNALPRTVCFVCYDSLNKAYDFLYKVKKAQDLLTTLFGTNEPSKYPLSDDDGNAFDDFLTIDNMDDIREVKREDSPCKTKPSPTIPNVNVKIEPKEEADATTILQDAINSIQSCSNEVYDQTLNVQDILDAALSNGSYTSDVQIYAKEVTDIGKKITSWKDYPWVCAHCNTEFLDMDMLRSHSKVAHGKCAAFTCVDCKVFRKKDDFESFLKHVRKHRKALRKQCHLCDEVLELENMTVHYKQHVPKGHLPCPYCGDILKNEDTLRQHVQEYISVKQKRKPRRKAGTPITAEDLTCHICKKVYKNPNSLRDHIKRHIGDRKRNFTCDRCGKTFFNKGTLSSHIMAHDEIRPHVCRICNKSFIFPNMLRRHVEMHTGVKPFSCEQCGRCFRLQYQLNNHKIIHTDSMPYVCQYCNKAFRFKQILKNHERQHTGAKPYCCQHCGMEFSNWSNYNKHTKRRHNIDTSKKKITPAGVFPINPETGQLVQVDVQGVEEWKTKIMIPAKRGKKKVIKQETLDI